MAEGGVTQSHEVLKNELQKCMQIIETTLNKISGLDVVINPADVQPAIHRDGKRDLQRKITDYRQIFINTLKENVTPTVPVAERRHSEIEEAKSVTSSTNSKRSSTSSKARTAAWSAEIARLKLQQAMRKSQLKERQIQEQAQYEMTRVELETKKAETQLEEHLQDLRDEVECAQYKAELLAADEQLENEALGGSGDGPRLELVKEILGLPTRENIALTDEDVPTSTPNQERPSPPDFERYQLAPLTTPKEEVQGNVIERGTFNSKSSDVSLTKVTPLNEKTNLSSLDQSLANSLVQMNQQLVGVMKQNTEATTVMKAMLQRQGIPKPNPPKVVGDPAEFPVFKQQMQDWLDKKGFTGKEKVTHLLSFVHGDAKEAIKHCEIEDGYSEAMTILEGQYGHPAKVIMRDVLAKPEASSKRQKMATSTSSDVSVAASRSLSFPITSTCSSAIPDIMMSSSAGPSDEISFEDISSPPSSLAVTSTPPIFTTTPPTVTSTPSTKCTRCAKSRRKWRDVTRKHNRLKKRYEALKEKLKLLQNAQVLLFHL
ncbi:hypothetical protein OS493_011487 [Desmophyllum pertusum]|uniref:Uncharacterized protein n=1 Tax=Desmophyllum pertusum TaxID=174260 RepID=A0A9W9YQG6_9CNID|nr:hypothetical protein OS493_011487 [Desmophyllum pertusum]